MILSSFGFFNVRKSKIDVVNANGVFLLKVLWVIIKVTLVLKSS